MMHPYDDGDDSEEFGIPPSGGQFDPEDREAMFITACRKNLSEIRQHRHEIHNLLRRLLEILMTRKRSKTLLVDFRPQLLKSVVFCGRLGASFLKGAGLSPEWQRVISEVAEADKYDSEAWFTRGYRVTLSAHIAAASMIAQLLIESETLGTENTNDPYVADWLREVYGIGPSDIPF